MRGQACNSSPATDSQVGNHRKSPDEGANPHKGWCWLAGLICCMGNSWGQIQRVSLMWRRRVDQPLGAWWRHVPSRHWRMEVSICVIDTAETGRSYSPHIWPVWTQENPCHPPDMCRWSLPAGWCERTKQLKEHIMRHPVDRTENDSQRFYNAKHHDHNEQTKNIN